MRDNEVCAAGAGTLAPALCRLAPGQLVLCGNAASCTSWTRPTPAMACRTHLCCPQSPPGAVLLVLRRCKGAARRHCSRERGAGGPPLRRSACTRDALPKQKRRVALSARPAGQRVRRAGRCACSLVSSVFCIKDAASGRCSRDCVVHHVLPYAWRWCCPVAGSACTRVVLQQRHVSFCKRGTTALPAGLLGQA